MNEASLVLQYRPPSPPRFYESTSCNHGHGLLKYNAWTGIGYNCWDCGNSFWEQYIFGQSSQNHGNVEHGLLNSDHFQPV